MGKHGIVEGRARRCRCGRIKPSNRKQCFTCRPKRSRIKEPVTDEPYSQADREAQARACGLSYGKLMTLVEIGAALPFRSPVEWPDGSAHIGE